MHAYWSKPSVLCWLPVMAGYDPKNVGQLIRQARERARLTQEALAEKADVAGETIRRIELGKYEPSLTSVVAIADALTLSLDQLIGRRVTASEPPLYPPVVSQLASTAASLPLTAQRALLTVAEAFPLQGTPKDSAPAPQVKEGLSGATDRTGSVRRAKRK